jgi:cation transport regulator
MSAEETFMPFEKKSDLPKQVKDNLPPKARKIWQEAYNNAYEQYKSPDKRRGSASREEVSAKVAWSAVKDKYKKGSDGKWHPK